MLRHVDHQNLVYLAVECPEQWLGYLASLHGTRLCGPVLCPELILSSSNATCDLYSNLFQYFLN